MVLPRKIRPGKLHPLVDGRHVRIDGFLFSFELLADGGDDLLAIDADQLRHDADVNHVRQQFAQAGVGGQLTGQLGEGDLVEDDVLAD